MEAKDALNKYSSLEKLLEGERLKTVEVTKVRILFTIICTVIR